MAWLNLPADLTKIEDSLTRIANALDRAYPPALAPQTRHLRGLEALVDISGEAVESREVLESFLDLQGMTEKEKGETKKEIESLPAAVKKTFLDSIRRGL